LTAGDFSSSAPFTCVTAPRRGKRLEPSYQPAAEFTKFWDEDASRAEDTIRQIGKVG